MESTGMSPEVLRNYSTFLTLQIVLASIFMFPDISFLLWKGLLRQWTLRRDKMMLRRSRRAEEKLKKYWEIDIRRLR
jgi:hypothetical protein